MKILIVCLGNICRSPIAEGILRQLIQQHQLPWEVDSAGTESFHIGEPPHPYSQQVCREHGIDISHQRATKFYHSETEKYDKIYAMADDVLQEIREICGKKFDASKVDLFLNVAYPGENQSVKDPWYGELDGYYEVYEVIKKGCEAIIGKYNTAHS